MFKPQAMRYISLNLLRDDVPVAAQTLAECGLFNPELPQTEQLIAANTHFRTTFQSAYHRFEKITQQLSFTLPKITESYQPVAIKTLEQIDEQLGELWQHLSHIEEQRHQLQAQQKEVEQLLNILDKFTNLNVNLEKLRKTSQFLNLNIGTLPHTNLTQLIEAAGLAEHLVTVFHSDEHYVYCVIAGPLEYQQQIHSLLNHAEFRALEIPKEFQASPEQVRVELTDKKNQLIQQFHLQTEKLHQLALQHQATLNHSYQTLTHAAAYATLSENLKIKGQLAVIEGWLPTAELRNLEKRLNATLVHPFVLSHRKPQKEEIKSTPSLLAHPTWLQAFVTLVKNFGLPRYGEFDPTLLFAVTFTLMFGAMFGDVGHGFVIAAAGWYWHKKLKSFAPFFMLAGASSIVFGFLYGSVFGFEEVVIPALWLSPLHHPFLMLQIALYWGIGFILLATLLTVINQVQWGEFSAALFDARGIAGICLYVGGFYAIQRWMETGTFDLTQQLAILAPLVIVLSYKWYENKLPLGERILVTAIEGLESVTNYLANTLSFLRVAAFSLNHVALAVAVFTLADMMSTPASSITIVLGNVFIIGLEGAIVTIQVLRLEYYEGFSRFFSGDGRPFQPLKKGIKLNGY